MIHNPHTSRLDLLKESAERSAKDIELRKEELMHHGILGMKWGIRRYQPYPKGHNQLKEGGRFTGNKPKKMSKKERLEKRIESSRKEGVAYANKLAADRKKGTSAANALVSAKRKAKEKGIVDSDFLNNPNISQKAKNEVTNLAKRRASKDKKRNLKEMNREIAKRSIDLTIGSNNYAAARINGEWLNNFNKKWSKEFKGYDVWTESPKYNEYRKAYNKNLVKLSNEYLKTTTKSEFTTKLGQKYTAGFLEEHGQRVMWATPAEWAEYKAKKGK